MRFTFCRLLQASAFSFILSACLPTSSPTLSPTLSGDGRAEAAVPPAEIVKETTSGASDQEQVEIASADGSEPSLSLPRGPVRPTAPIREDAGGLLNGLPKGAAGSFMVIDLERGEVMASHREDDALIPASTMKIATALVALNVLGPDHRYLTTLHGSGSIVNGVLEGDLILQGGGDPLLDIADLLLLAGELRKLGIQSIDGRFLIDDSRLPTLGEIEPHQPLEAAYNPSLGALSLAFNRVHLSWRSGREPRVATVPMLDEALFEKEARDLLPPSGVQMKEEKNGRILWQLADRGARRSKRSLPVKDPGLHTGHVFTSIAAMQGIDLPPPSRAVKPAEARLIARHQSRPLRELVRDMLWYSNNLMAELIGLSVARESSSDIGGLEDSAEILIGHLRRLVPDADWDKAVIDNHSGLDHKARMTPAQLVGVLQRGWQDGTLIDLLPVSGWSGTLSRRLNEQDEALRVWAKTGSLNYADGLAGFMLSPTYGPAAFAVLVSDLEARAAYDALPRKTRQSEKEAGAWKKETQDVIDQLLSDWLDTAPTHLAAHSAR